MMPSESRIEVAAYYFPQYHRDARNDAWHGAGWTEWDLVKAARPRFVGHQQPIVPAWGHFDEADPQWTAREIDLAADHGVTCFLYDWYWYEDGPFLLDALAHGFFEAPNNHRIKFALMWANHDWQNIHPANYRNHPETLAYGRNGRDGFDRMVDYVVENCFGRGNYLCVNGEPYFSIYELGSFVDGLGGVDAAVAALEAFRARTRSIGYLGLHLNAVAWQADPEIVERLGISSVTSYCWVHHADPNSDGFPKAIYANAAQRNYAAWDQLKERYTVPYFPNVSMGWDPSPRTVQTDRYDNRGYPFTAIYHDNDPAIFKEALVRASELVMAYPETRRIITVNAWNEWTEGSYLLPDERNGTAYLEAIREVFGVRR